MRYSESFFSPRLRRRPLTTLLGVAASFLLGSGCSPPPRTVEVVGRVTYNGAPVEGALVVFIGAEYGDDLPAAGSTDATGRYELRTYFSAHDMPLGALPNDYVVSIEKLKRPDVLRAQLRMAELARQGADVKRYIAEEAIYDIWPDGVPDGWPHGYIPAVNLYPKRIFENQELRAKLSRLERGIHLLPERYADPSTSGFRATVERSDGPLTFDFDLTDQIEEAVPVSVTESPGGSPG
jgi:hypothetical protein